MDKFQIRKLFQYVFLGIWLLLFLYLIPVKIHTCHQFCPYSVICFGPMIFRGLPVYFIAVIIGLIILISTIFIGRRFCGYICFLGTIQEYIFKLNPFKNKTRISHKLDKYIRILKYLVLIITLYMSIALIQYLYMQFCPIVIFSFPGAITKVGFVTLVIIFIGGFFIERFWCRYFCPYAALMNIFQFVGKLLGIKKHMIYRNWEICGDCNICIENCSMNIDISKYEEISDPNCIHCLKCIKICPKENGIFY